MNAMIIPESCTYVFFFIFKNYLFIFIAAPAAYGSSQVSGRIRVVAVAMPDP